MDTISNYRQVRLILNPHPIDPAVCGYQVVALTVRKGIPRAETLRHGQLVSGAEPLSRSDFWAMMARICEAEAAR